MKKFVFAAIAAFVLPTMAHAAEPASEPVKACCCEKSEKKMACCDKKNGHNESHAQPHSKA